ncbi:hypothetical protein FACS1894166_12660 [Bacilli bacterium]|nr:hypothetical protein FACS1894166_12660 [Bacilli bacterium]
MEIKQMATNKGYKNLRLYTNSHYNAKAVKVYEKLKGLQENYNNINDEFDGSNTLIFSWNLTGEKIEF